MGNIYPGDGWRYHGRARAEEQRRQGAAGEVEIRAREQLELIKIGAAATKAVGLPKD